MRIRYEGERGFGVTAKDLILATIGQMGVDGAVGHVVEYSRPGDPALSMEGRMTVCNMTIEGGGRAGMVAPDDVTFEWFERTERPGARAAELAEAIEGWRALHTDDGARFDREVVIDAAAISPRSPGAPTRGWSSASPAACRRPTSSTRPPTATPPSARCATWASRGARRSRRSASIACSSARAPTRGSATCAPPRR